MLFSELDATVRQDITALLNAHIEASAEILEEDGYIPPMLLFPDTEALSDFSEIEEDIDEDTAYAVTIEALSGEDFSYAVLSFSTTILLRGEETEALKTFIFSGDGLECLFYTPYTISGGFRKTVQLQKTVIFDVRENVF